jgi:NAD(P)-dependent dehydrogenase (short-subunit alcohol dehydrogenase family)
MTIDLTGQVALVTGANRGIGRQLAIDLARAGAFVALSARQLDTLGPLAARIRDEGGRCDAVALDVTQAESVQAAVATVLARHGQIDLLVNNAGIGAGSRYPWDLPVDEWWAVQEVNVRGTYLCTQAVMRHMTERRAGRIIDIGSLVGANPNPGAAPYAVSKAALFRWNSCVAAAAAEFGVAVFIVSPGLVATDMTNQPQFADIPADQWVPIEKSGALVVGLASGKADALSGRFIHAEDDLDALIAAADTIVANSLLTLGMQSLSEG